jgi:hypothetical protein
MATVGEWTFALAGLAGGFWLFFRACQICERHLRHDPPGWLTAAVGIPLFLIFICGGSFLGLAIEDLIFNHERVVRYVLSHWL